METITRKLPIPVVPLYGNEEALSNYTDYQKNIIRLWRALPDYRANILVHDVLAVISERHKLHLIFKQWLHGDTIVATDGRTTYYLVGSWHDSRYICNGLVKGRKGCKHTYLINGQSNTGTIQIEHYGEELQIDYPEIKDILKNLPF